MRFPNEPPHEVPAAEGIEMSWSEWGRLEDLVASPQQFDPTEPVALKTDLMPLEELFTADEFDIATQFQQFR